MSLRPLPAWVGELSGSSADVPIGFYGAPLMRGGGGLGEGLSGRRRSITSVCVGRSCKGCGAGESIYRGPRVEEEKRRQNQGEICSLFFIFNFLVDNYCAINKY